MQFRKHSTTEHPLNVRAGSRKASQQETSKRATHFHLDIQVSKYLPRGQRTITLNSLLHLTQAIYSNIRKILT